MSRLDINIRRLKAQRACLNAAARAIQELPGVALELGLGNGRTFDHLREVMPDREIFVFDREIAAHPDCIPDEAHMILGRFQETLPGAAERFAGRAALVHADFGSANSERDAAMAAIIAEFLPTLLRPGGLVAADRDVRFAKAEPVPLPDGVEPGVYFMYRRAP